MVITLLPVLIIKFLHLLIAVISCVNNFLIKSVLPETGCLHYLLPPPRNESAVEKLRHYTQFIPAEKARTSRFHSSFIMYALRNFQQITFFGSPRLYMLYTIPPLLGLLQYSSLSLFLFIYVYNFVLFILYFIYLFAKPCYPVQIKLGRNVNFHGLPETAEYIKINTSYADPYIGLNDEHKVCLLYTSPSPRDRTRSRMPSSA